MALPWKRGLLEFTNASTASATMAALTIVIAATQPTSARAGGGAGAVAVVAVTWESCGIGDAHGGARQMRRRYGRVTRRRAHRGVKTPSSPLRIASPGATIQP